MLQGWGLEGWGLGLPDLLRTFWEPDRVLRSTLRALCVQGALGCLTRRAFRCTLCTKTPERAFYEPSANLTGFLEARSGIYVPRVPQISLGRHGWSAEILEKRMLFRGPRNGAFGKPCPCPRDTRHFRHFRRFTGLEQQNPCFTGSIADSSFSPFSSKPPFFWWDKSTVYQKHRFRDSDCWGPTEKPRQTFTSARGALSEETISFLPSFACSCV